MGIPLFTSVLIKKYDIVQKPLRNFQPKLCGISYKLPTLDEISLEPNNNDTNYLYVDLNSIVHPMMCFPEVNSRNYTRGFAFIGAYLDRLILTFVPNKLIYIAVDGVAPAAKMIQQRTRRYRKASELIAKKKIHNHINELLRSKDASKFDIDEDLYFDSNCISPGTDFMRELDGYMNEYICLTQQKLQEKGLRVSIIYSGHKIAGEGEHKILDFVKANRHIEVFYNSTHVLFSPDADLILLLLASHVKNILLVREDFKTQNKVSTPVQNDFNSNNNSKSNKDNSTKNKLNSSNDAKRNNSNYYNNNTYTEQFRNKDKNVQYKSNAKIVATAKNRFQSSSSLTNKKREPTKEEKQFKAECLPYLHGLSIISIEKLRHSIVDCIKLIIGEDYHLTESQQNSIISDFVFISILIGNDFLPNIRDLSISSGGFDLAFIIYCFNLSKLNGFLIKDYTINWPVIHKFFQILNKYSILFTYIQEIQDIKSLSITGRNLTVSVNELASIRFADVDKNNRSFKSIVFNFLKNIPLIDLNTYTVIPNISTKSIFPNIPMAIGLQLKKKNSDKSNTLSKDIYTNIYDSFIRMRESALICKDLFESEDKFISFLLDQEFSETDFSDKLRQKVTEYTKNNNNYIEQRFVEFWVCKFVELVLLDMYKINDNIIVNFEMELKERNKRHFHIKDSDNSQLYETEMGKHCKKYFDTLQWVTEYYFGKISDWSFFYDSPDAPYISDLANFLKKTSYQGTNFKKTGPVNEAIQLITIIPVTSKKIFSDLNVATHIRYYLDSKIIGTSIVASSHYNTKSWMWHYNLNTIDLNKLIDYWRNHCGSNPYLHYYDESPVYENRHIKFVYTDLNNKQVVLDFTNATFLQGLNNFAVKYLNLPDKMSQYCNSYEPIQCAVMPTTALFEKFPGTYFHTLPKNSAKNENSEQKPDRSRFYYTQMRKTCFAKFFDLEIKEIR